MSDEPKPVEPYIVIDTDKTNVFIWDHFQPYRDNAPCFQDYREGLEKSGSVPNDSIQRRLRHLGLYDLLVGVLDRGVEGDVAECGCWRGASTHTISRVLKRRGFNGRFHVFDSFEGLSEPGEIDLKGTTAIANRSEYVHMRKGLFSSSEEHIRSVLAEFDFVDIWPGWIPERFEEVSDRCFRFVNIDVDLYEPIHDSLAFFYPRMQKGGVIFLDDYNSGSFLGATIATDEFLKTISPTQFLPIPGGGAFILV